MSITKRICLVILAAGTLLASATLKDAAAGGRDALGIRAGVSLDPDQFVLGGQAEFGPVVGPAYLVPSLDFGFGDASTVAIANVDLRWYLLPLPETGVQFYGSAGPTLVLSPDTEFGFTLTAGMDVPMKGQRRYNLELRFGFGDAPDLKIMAGLIFGM